MRKDSNQIAKRIAAEIFGRFGRVEVDKEIPPPDTQARQETLVRIQCAEQIRSEGERVGEQREARTAVHDLCEVLQVPLPAPRRKQVEKMSLDELRALRQHLKKHRSWPQS